MSREKGDKLEERVSRDIGIPKTNNSGAKFDNGDLSNRYAIVECKYKDKPFLHSPNSELKKLIKQAKKHSKDWFYIQENRAGIFVIVDYNLFIEMYYDAYHDRIK